MASNTPARRSRRAAKSNKKYTTDAFAGIESLIMDSDSGSNKSSAPEDAESDDVFDEREAAREEAEAAVEDAEDLSDQDLANTSEEERAEAAAAAGSGEESDDIESVEGGSQLRTKPFNLSRTPRGKGIVASEVHSLPAFDQRGDKPTFGNNARHTRGIPEIYHNQGKETRLIYTIGPGSEDLAAHVRARDRWIDEVTLPSRKSTKSGSGGLAYSFFHTEERRQKEASQGWDWYYEQGCGEIFRKEQNSSVLNAEHCREMFLRSVSRSDPFLTGPTREPKLFEGLEPATFANVRDAWSTLSGFSKKQAWVINAGSRVQCAEWAPNQNGLSQYLAVAIVPKTTKKAASDNNPDPPAYTASSTFSACLQIWEFQALEAQRVQGSKIDFSKLPVLRFVFSSGWGAIKRLKWCPTPAREELDHADQAELRLGLLAGVWSDGKVRVLDIRPKHPNGSSTQYIYLSKSAFESKPPDAICTCITWLSSGSIAAGCDNGYVAVWSIPEALKRSYQQDVPNPRNINPKPWLYQPFHQSYILSITSAYPSRPHFIVTNSIDGYLRLTDLRAPNQDTVLSQRVRISQPPLIWHDVTQASLSADDNFEVKACFLRLFHKTHSIARMTALVTDIATSPLHASILVGCVDGSVSCTNPMRKIRDHKNTLYQQIWFRHEWRRGIPQSRTAAENTQTDIVMEDAGPANQVSQRDQTPSAPPGQSPFNSKTQLPPTPQDTQKASLLSQPLIRITSGYKLSKPDLSQETRSNMTKDGVIYATVYEEKSAVTQVCWNPNLRAGTWAAAGMGSGLVFVEDLGAD